MYFCSVTCFRVRRFNHGTFAGYQQRQQRTSIYIYIYHKSFSRSGKAFLSFECYTALCEGVSISTMQLMQSENILHVFLVVVLLPHVTSIGHTKPSCVFGLCTVFCRAVTTDGRADSLSGCQLSKNEIENCSSFKRYYAFHVAGYSSHSIQAELHTIGDGVRAIFTSSCPGERPKRRRNRASCIVTSRLPHNILCS